MNFNFFSASQLSVAIDFMSFFLVAPELLGEKSLRKIRIAFVFLFFLLNIVFIITISLMFFVLLVGLPLILVGYSVFFSYYADFFVVKDGLWGNGPVMGYLFLLTWFSPLIFLAISYLPPLITNLLETLANQQKTRLILIRTGVILFIVGKLIEFVSS